MLCNIRSVQGARPPVTRMSRIIARVYTLNIAGSIARVYTLDIARSKWAHLISLVLPRVPRCGLLALPHPLAVLVCVVDQVLQPVPGVLHTQQTVLRHLGHR